MSKRADRPRAPWVTLTLVVLALVGVGIGQVSATGAERQDQEEDLAEMTARMHLEKLESAVLYEFPRLRPDGISHTDFNLLMKALATPMRIGSSRRSIWSSTTCPGR